jgi:predicted metal-dependent peptidase
MFRKVVLTPDQERMKVETLAAFMKYAPFFAYYFYDQMVEYPTLDIPTAATDTRRLFFNPVYMATLKPLERAFVYAHEVYHSIYLHPIRMRAYGRAGELRGLPFDRNLFNQAADYCINADLIDNKIGLCNPTWLYDPQIKGNELPEDVYVKLYRPPPPPPPGGTPCDDEDDQPGRPGGHLGNPGGQPGNPGGRPDIQSNHEPSTYGEHSTSGRYLKPDKEAASNGGRFDDVLEPEIDPATGKPDVPTEMEFKEALARALDAAEKAQGKVPGNIKRIVEEVLNPQIGWREHIRLLVTGKIGMRRETWTRPNRRRVAMQAMSGGPMIILPGRTRYGCELVVCVADNSGSINNKELSVFFGEMAGLLADCNPRTIIVMWVDAELRKVTEVRSAADLAQVRREGSPGGGGTDFRPAFEYLKDKTLRPDAMIYFTDMYGTFPEEKPRFPVIWCATTDAAAPWGEIVRVKI